MAGKLLDIGHDNRAVFLPSRTAHAFAVAYMHTSHRTLEWAKNQLSAFNTVKARPPKAKTVVQHCHNVGHCRNLIVLTRQKAGYLFV